MADIISGEIGRLNEVTTVLTTDRLVINTRKPGEAVNTFTAKASPGAIVAAGFADLTNVTIENLTVDTTFTMTGVMAANFDVGGFAFVSTGADDINLTPAAGRLLNVNGDINITGELASDLDVGSSDIVSAGANDININPAVGQQLNVNGDISVIGSLASDLDVGSSDITSTGANDINLVPAAGQDVSINGNCLIGQAVLSSQVFN